MVNIQLLLLAAGASSRMGKPKQLLQWGTETLIEHQIKNLLNTNNPVSVVIGAHAEEINKSIHDFSVNIFTNENWIDGMGSSIAYGVQQLLEKDSTIDGILISLIDQPLLTTDYFKEMLNCFESQRKKIIVSSSKEGWFGAPVLFDKIYFNDLLKLKGDEGAKTVFNKYSDSVELIEGNSLLTDIDTPEAYQQLLDELIKKS